MSLVALIKLAFLHSKRRVPKPYAQLFEEEWCTCNLRLKARRLNKSKYYPFKLENTVKTAFVSMESILERDFLKVYTAFEKSTRGMRKMDLFSNRLYILNSKIGWVESLSLQFENFWKELCSQMARDIRGSIWAIWVASWTVLLVCWLWSRLTLRASQPRTYDVLTLTCPAANKE